MPHVSGTPDREAIGIWRSRLRWRLRGAWQWPTFAVATLVDAVLLGQLPFSGSGLSLLPAVLLAGFFNLFVVAVIAPAGGALLRRRRRGGGLPKDIASDYAGTAGLICLAMAMAAGGAAHRPAVAQSEADLRHAVDAARRFAAHRAPARYQPGLDRGDTWTQGPELYRTCFPGPDELRDFCVIVRTDEPVPIVARDPDQRPNATVAGPDNPGRRAG
jgi:hypothetical protein